MRPEQKRQIPRFPNSPRVFSPADRGAPLPPVNWNNRFTYVRVGTNQEGRPIVEAQPKAPPR
jgi:hypothetical protein